MMTDSPHQYLLWVDTMIVQSKAPCSLQHAFVICRLSAIRMGRFACFGGRQLGQYSHRGSFAIQLVCNAKPDYSGPVRDCSDGSLTQGVGRHAELDPPRLAEDICA